MTVPLSLPATIPSLQLSLPSYITVSLFSLRKTFRPLFDFCIFYITPTLRNLICWADETIGWLSSIATRRLVLDAKRAFQFNALYWGRSNHLTQASFVYRECLRLGWFSLPHTEFFRHVRTRDFLLAVSSIEWSVQLVYPSAFNDVWVWSLPW